LTIKLTQHVSVPRRTERRIAARRSLLQGDIVCEFAQRARASSPSTFATRANLRFTPSISLPQPARKTENVNCQLPSVVKELREDHQCRSQRLCAWQSATRFGAEVASNKKPGVERRVSPSILQGIPPWDGFARSSANFYPEFVTNLTSKKTRQIAGPSASYSAYTDTADNRKV